MNSLLPILLMTAMGLTVAVLLVGIVSFAFNSKFGARYSTRLMTARVVLQAIAIALFALIVLFSVN